MKPIKVKPHFYAVCLLGLQEIAKEMGYNLVIHGSMNRDMDLVAIPWIDEPKTHLELLTAFCEYLGVYAYDKAEHFMYSVLPGGRHAYVINLHRDGERLGNYNGYEDAQYYLDISITPTL